MARTVFIYLAVIEWSQDSKGGRTMRKKVLWAMMLVGLFGLTVPNMAFCKTEGRMALLIGNGEYLHGGRLANPVSDARGMKTALEGLGFTVFKYENCTQKAMKEAMDNFGIKLKGQEVGLFFYAGHGVQVSGYNYLIPVDANLSNENLNQMQEIQANLPVSQLGGRTPVVRHELPGVHQVDLAGGGADVLELEILFHAVAKLSHCLSP